MIIKPYSAIRDDSFAAADYPSCKLLFKCDEASGNSLVESVSGLSVATGLTLDRASAAYAVRMTATGTNIALGQTVAIGTKSALIFAVANLGTLSFINLGIASVNKILIGSAARTVSDGTNTSSSTAPTTGAILGHGEAFVSGTANEGTAYMSSTTVWTAPEVDSAAPGDLTTLGDITHFASLGSTIGNLDLYGVALFVFDAGLPADIAPAIQWMTAEWQLGNKSIYPGWKGLN